MMDPKSNGVQADQGGEGNYDANRRYQKGLEQSVKKGNTEELAEKARKALEGPEGEELRKADEQGAKGSPPAADDGRERKTPSK